VSWPVRSISARRTSAALLAAALTLTLGATGCGDGDEEGSGPVGEELGGSVAQLVQCSDWTGASDDQQLATVEDIRSHVNQEDSGVTASELTDDEAMEVFDHGCARPGSEGYRLYVMYARAAAFKPLREIAEGEAQ
jgi:hypothetical protein